MSPTESDIPRTVRSGILLLASVALGFAAATRADTDASFLLTATAKDLGNYFPAYLANGYVSTLSTPRGTEGTPAYLVAFMDYATGDMSRPAAIPGWTEIDYSTGPGPTGQSWLNKVSFKPSRFRDYRQTLNLREATLTTNYVYVDGRRNTAVEVVSFVDQANPHLAATQLSITPDFDGVVQLSFALNLWAPYQPRLPLATLSGEQMEEQLAAQGQSRGPVPPATPDRAAVWYHGDTHVSKSEGDADNLALWLQGQAEQGLTMAQAATIGISVGLVPETVNLYKSPYRLAVNLSVKLSKNQTYRFAKFVTFSRQGWGGDASEDLQLAKTARTTGFDQLLAEHRAAWQRLWQTDILIDGDARAQQAVHSELYYLLSSSTADTAWPLGACAMTPGYAGHAFWDSDTWMFPALLLLHPERAKSLVMFRDRTLAPAQARANERHLEGAMFPWESDPENGSEQTPHSAYILGEREIHVNADIAISQWQYYLATGDLDWLKTAGWPVIRNVAQFWTSRATYVPERHRYEILHVTSVSESYSDVPNDTFTNASASKALAIAASAAALVGERADPRWADIARRLYIPTGGTVKHHLKFDPSVQLDSNAHSDSTLFLSYPSLDLPMSMQLRRADYDAAVSPESQAHGISDSMGLEPRSVAAATLGDAAAAAAWFQDNFSGGTLKPPFNVRTETADNNTGYFITGSGGYIQNLLYGFTGLRIREQGLVEAYPPLLPADWKSLTLQNIEFHGHRYDVVIARDATGRVRLVRRRR
ncbi:MAG: glycoside hydrolase family 65 protein [Steroidobacteraceae bacterium]